MRWIRENQPVAVALCALCVALLTLLNQCRTTGPHLPDVRINLKLMEPPTMSLDGITWANDPINDIKTEVQQLSYAAMAFPLCVDMKLMPESALTTLEQRYESLKKRAQGIHTRYNIKAYLSNNGRSDTEIVDSRLELVGGPLGDKVMVLTNASRVLLLPVKQGNTATANVSFTMSIEKPDGTNSTSLFAWLFVDDEQFWANAFALSKGETPPGFTRDASSAGNGRSNLPPLTLKVECQDQHGNALKTSLALPL